MSSYLSLFWDKKTELIYSIITWVYSVAVTMLRNEYPVMNKSDPTLWNLQSTGEDTW